MGKHSKPQAPLAPRLRRPLLVTALIPVVGAFAVAASAGADQHPNAAAPHTTTVAATSAGTPTAQTTSHPPVTSPTPQAADRPLVAQPVRAAPLPVSVTNGSVPAINYRAYAAAAATMSHTQPHCGIAWPLIAGIGKVESHHANEGDTDAAGTLRTPIYGPTLDGSLAGNQVITDTDGGRLDGDPVHDRAVGPMQFLPQTWEKYAADGNGDGVADPQNVFDAALTTARYLCDGNLDLRTEAAETTAVLRYNNSMDYVANVLGFARGY